MENPNEASKPKFKIPTETVDLPSKGKFYPEGHPLKSGTVEMKYMTAKEEDILTNQNYIQRGIVIDKLLKSLLVTDFNYDDLLIGDKNAIMVAARILSYGKDYEIEYKGQKISVDLSEIKEKEFDSSVDINENGEFTFNLPKSGNEVTFKLLTHGDDRKIDREIEGLKKISRDNDTSVTTRMKHLITSVNGERETSTIRQFVDQGLLAADARALREEYGRVQPDVEFKVYHVNEDGVGEDIDVPVTINFFWPDA
jgi:hypothetical protein